MGVVTRRSSKAVAAGAATPKVIEEVAKDLGVPPAKAEKIGEMAKKAEVVKKEQHVTPSVAAAVVTEGPVQGPQNKRKYKSRQWTVNHGDARFRRWYVRSGDKSGCRYGVSRKRHFKGKLIKGPDYLTYRVRKCAFKNEKGKSKSRARLSLPLKNKGGKLMKWRAYRSPRK